MPSKILCEEISCGIKKHTLLQLKRSRFHGLKHCTSTNMVKWTETKMTKSCKFQSQIWCFIKEINLDEYPRHSPHAALPYPGDNPQFHPAGLGQPQPSQLLKHTNLQSWTYGHRCSQVPQEQGGKVHIIRKLKHRQLEMELLSWVLPFWLLCTLEVSSTGVTSVEHRNISIN